jgi:hypothetical protein
MKDQKDSEETSFSESKSTVLCQPRILISGLLPGQQYRLAQRFEGKALLSFVESGVRYLSGSQDYVIIAAKFASHSTFNSIKSKIFGKRIRLLIHRGGLTTLAERIEELIARSKQQESETDSEV